ncbi:MAG: flavodoxin family protein [Actinobacteria bacterium]|jgi:multimeric flavodoxin WrbA|nr:MAG: flavodoxin family protein [Actinomycetota bacterium]
MYILAINGSPDRKGNTAILLQAVVDAAGQEGVEGRLVHVMDAVKGQKMPFCVACSSPCKEACHEKDAGLREMCDALEGAAAVVLGSPVYFGTVSAQLKALWDKTRAIRTRKSLVAKPAAAVSVGAARFGGQETTLKALHDMLLVQGMSIVGEGADDADAGHQGVCAQKPAQDDSYALERAGILGRRLAREVKKAAS